MEEQYITFETADLAQEKGFNIRCEYFYNEGSGWKLQSDSILRTGKDEFLEAPTQSQLQKWLRDEKDIFVNVEPIRHNEKIKYSALVLSLKGNDSKLELLLDGFTMYSSYEDAIEEGLQESLKLIK